jgi:aryl-alcohol dehydrogenase-like predicted oxidoreductase
MLENITLGCSGLRVTALCLGTMTFGGSQENWTCGEEIAECLVRAYFDAGGNFIDTADAYHMGESERIVGRILRKLGVREQTVLATKFTFGSGATGINATGNGRKNAYRALDDSLRRLDTDYVDLYWMHAWDTITPVEEVVQTLDSLVRAGKIRYYGLSDVPVWYAVRASGDRPGAWQTVESGSPGSRHCVRDTRMECGRGPTTIWATDSRTRVGHPYGVDS